MTIALRWPISGGVSQLGLLSGGTVSYPWAASSDGSVICGYSDAGSPGSPLPVRWNILAVTQLAVTTGTQQAVWLSQDGSTTFVGSALNNTRFSSWDSNGAVGANLTLPVDYTAAHWDPEPVAGRTCSDDGSIIVGTCVGPAGSNPTQIATVWNAGVPTTLPGVFGGTQRTEAKGCSQDGALIFGIGTATISIACYWTGSLPRSLASVDTGDNYRFAAFCDGAGATIWGVSADNSTVHHNVYWDTLGSSAGHNGYGVIHTMDSLPLSTNPTADSVNYVSETGGIAVGAGLDSTGTGVAIKWAGITPTALPLLPGGLSAVAFGCSADGSIVVGRARDSGGNFLPVYWDAANAIHELPLLAGAPLSGQALGISRDGSTIFGTGEPPPNPAPGIPLPFCGAVHTTTSFTAAWTPTGAAADTYTVDYRKVGDTSFSEVSGVTDTFLLITGLIPNAAYEFKVSATNSGGTSDFSSLAECSTLAQFYPNQFMICGNDWTITQPSTVIYGLDHLAGLVVTGLIDGIVLPPTMVGLDGKLTLPFPASFVTIGLGFTPQLQTTYLDAGSPTIQGRRKNILAVTARVMASQGVQVGTNQPDGSVVQPNATAPAWSGMQDDPAMLGATYMSPSGQTVNQLVTGDLRAQVLAEWKVPGQVAIQGTPGLPLNVLAVVPELSEGDTVESAYTQRQQGQDRQQRGERSVPGTWMLGRE